LHETLLDYRAAPRDSLGLLVQEPSAGDSLAGPLGLGRRVPGDNQMNNQLRMLIDKWRKLATPAALKYEHTKLIAETYLKCSDELEAVIDRSFTQVRLEEAKWWLTTRGDQIHTTGELHRKRIAELEAAAEGCRVIRA